MTNISVCKLKASSGSAFHDEVSMALLFVLYHIVTDSIYCREERPGIPSPSLIEFINKKGKALLNKLRTQDDTTMGSKLTLAMETKNSRAKTISMPLKT